MRVVAFVGPSLPPEVCGDFHGIEWLPPAQAGDLLKLTPEPGLTVALIDGYFDHRPAVRHKEILLLLSEGVRILGASSIGALRAAEMAPFGMIGIGAIYRAYQQGSVTADDEVALIHAGAERGWKPLSLPLVDVRSTLCRAVRTKILSGEQARAILRSARQIHYVDRDWPSVLEGTPPSFRIGNGFRAWLEGHKVAQKRIDAKACLKAALSPPPTDRPRPEAVPTAFLRALAHDCGISLQGRL